MPRRMRVIGSITSKIYWFENSSCGIVKQEKYAIEMFPLNNAHYSVYYSAHIPYAVYARVYAYGEDDPYSGTHKRRRLEISEQKTPSITM